jgi:hypothetical protein
VDTPAAAIDIATRVRGVVNTMDTVFVAELNLPNNYGFLAKEIWDWINARPKPGLLGAYPFPTGQI